MLNAITLQNFKGFGPRQRVPLGAITVLVGPNNAGKSNFMQASRFVRNMLVGSADDATNAEDGLDSLIHRPGPPGQDLVIGWETEAGKYEGCAVRPQAGGLSSKAETLDESPGGFTFSADTARPIAGFSKIIERYRQNEPSAVINAMARSALVRLSLNALRQEAQVVEKPEMLPDGTGIAPVLGKWQGGRDDLLAALDDFVGRCVTDVKTVRAIPGKLPGHQRLVFRDRSGNETGAHEASDGLMMFAGLAMNLISVGEGSVLFIEEPETCIHPGRLRHLVELMRKAVSSHRCQIVIATHSTVLLNEFRDEPDSILLFRRGAGGTEVTPSVEVPSVVAALRESSPGEMLETAFFEGLWQAEA